LDVAIADLLLGLRIRQPLYLRSGENELLIADRINEYSVVPRCLSIARLEIRLQGVDEASSQLIIKGLVLRYHLPLVLKGPHAASGVHPAVAVHSVFDVVHIALVEEIAEGEEEAEEGLREAIGSDGRWHAEDEVAHIEDNLSGITTE
jgi:hypothetical protein